MPPQSQLEIENLIEQIDQQKGKQSYEAIRQLLSRLDIKKEKINSQHDEVKYLAEDLAFSVTTENETQSPWPTYYGAIAMQTQPNGQVTYYPKIDKITPEIIEYWKKRALSSKNSFLAARYFDLVWDFSPRVSAPKENHLNAIAAINNYIQAISNNLFSELHERVECSIRALNLAYVVRDEELKDKARACLLDTHYTAIKQDKFWFKTFDRLTHGKRNELEQHQLDAVIESLLNIAKSHSSGASDANFNPFKSEVAINHLVAYFKRTYQNQKAKELLKLKGNTFEKLADMGSAFTATSHYQMAEQAYNEANLREDAQRMAVARKKAIESSHDEMASIEVSTTISNDDINTFVEGILHDKWPTTLARIANNFVWHYSDLEHSVRELSAEHPLSSMISLEIFDQDHTAARVGSVSEDIDGRIIRYALDTLSIQRFFLSRSFDCAIEKHELDEHMIVGFAAQSKLIDDLSICLQGVRAWLVGDHTKAIFLLVSQIENAFRNLADRIGLRTTKKHKTIEGWEIVVGLGETLSNDVLRDQIGNDIWNYFRILYVDPRGLNYRNRIAHGTVKPEELNSSTSNFLVHSLLVIGFLDTLAEFRKEKAASNEQDSAAPLNE